MLRLALGRPSWADLPWQFPTVVGGALLAAGGLFAVTYSWWSTWPALGALEEAIYFTTGGALVALGVRRRGRGTVAAARRR